LPRYLITAMIVACALFMENLDATVISTSLPAIAADLHEDPIALKLALTSYLLSLAIFIPASGWIADRFGARVIFRAAVVVFTLGSILCGFSSTLSELIGARMIQGLGGAMMVPVGRLLLLRSVPRSELVKALSYLTIPGLLGPVTGPLFGGFITTYFHWRWIFWINVPIGLLALILATVFIENVREEEVGIFDFKGFLFSGLGLACLIFSLAGAGRQLVSAQILLLLAAIGALALLAYVHHARKTPNPLLDLRLLAVPTFRASVTGGSLFRIGIGSISLLLPLMLQIGFGMSAFQSGSITFISSAGALLMKTTAAPILGIFGFRRVLIYDALLSALFLASFGFFTPMTPIALIMGVLLVGGFIRSLEFTSLNAIAYAEIDSSRLSSASTFAAVAQQLSLSLGIAMGAGVLQAIALLEPDGEFFTLWHFRWAFITMALISAASVLTFMQLPQDAGAELAQRGNKIDAKEA
jgi:EmrB/QacA subfamily drug resistance transporter